VDLTTQGLERFVQAQNRAYEAVLDELAMGEKTSHWMWFIFPQLRDLGRSAIAKHFGIVSKQEALEYWSHPVLGRRLLECVNLLLNQRNSDAHDIFGTPDDLKFRSCLTLFAQVAKNEAAFNAALTRFFGGKADESTLKLLKEAHASRPSPHA
jgi:uncharacterized protein (DUF1810 family)